MKMMEANQHAIWFGKFIECDVDGCSSIKEYGQSGHGIKDAEKRAFYRDVIHFLDSFEI